MRVDRYPSTKQHYKAQKLGNYNRLSFYSWAKCFCLDFLVVAFELRAYPFPPNNYVYHDDQIRFNGVGPQEFFFKKGEAQTSSLRARSVVQDWTKNYSS